MIWATPYRTTDWGAEKIYKLPFMASCDRTTCVLVRIEIAIWLADQALGLRCR